MAKSGGHGEITRPLRFALLNPGVRQVEFKEVVSVAMLSGFGIAPLV
jgi:hypothetical protein